MGQKNLLFVLISFSTSFGQGTGPIVAEDFGCRGNETNLAQCQHDPWTYHDCTHHEDASAVCIEGRRPLLKVAIFILFGMSCF